MINIKRFLKLDIRWKLKRISKKLGINLYPNYFKTSGFGSFYYRIIFNLIFFEKVFKKKKYINKNIYKISKSQNLKVNFIFSPPSSGSNYVRNFFSSYFELRYKIGNGIPKFDNYSTNRWMYSDTPIIRGDLFNNIVLEDIKKEEEWLFYNEEIFLKERIGMSRYPLQNIDLFQIENVFPLILIREPYDWILSIYNNQLKNSFYKNFNTESINEKIIKDSIKRYKKFTDFWFSYLKNKNHSEYMVLDYKNLINNSKKSFENICKFFKLPIEDEKIQRCININSKEFTLKNMEHEFKGTRFSVDANKKKIDEEIGIELKKKLNSSGIDEYYKKIINLYNL